MKNRIVFYTILVLLLTTISSFVFAEEADDLMVAGFELEKLLNFGSGLLATGLFTATLLAYRRIKNKRLIYVSAAFLLFAVKGFLTSHELFFKEWQWVDPIASVLNFAILLSFFFGVIKK
ncbi:MAG: hypothetical protein Q8R04_03965 [Nanoarchaeota archaeon]|nr:hypothetical protein [Nanoarchaeota archaeon]